MGISMQPSKKIFIAFFTSNTHRLAALCQALGSPLDYNSLEAAVLLLDKDGDGRIDYAEFANWWKGQDMF